MNTDASHDVDPSYPSPETEVKTEKKSVLAVVIHSFFVIPFLITVFSVLFVFMFLILTHEKNTAEDYLSDIRTGGVSKRWQAAFELSKILANPKTTPEGSQFRGSLINTFEEASQDDPRIQEYLALAMGRSGHSDYVPVLMDTLQKETGERRSTYIHALGLIQDPRALPVLEALTKDTEAGIRLLAVISVGQIGEISSLPVLIAALQDSEPNVTWDAAIALAKMGREESVPVLLQLLERDYLSQFKEVDIREQNKVLKVAIEAASYLKNEELHQKVAKLSESDANIQVKRKAFEALEQ